MDLKLLTKKEACKELRISMSSLNVLIRKNKIQTIKLERIDRIPIIALQNFITGELSVPKVNSSEKYKYLLSK